MGRQFFVEFVTVFDWSNKILIIIIMILIFLNFVVRVFRKSCAQMIDVGKYIIHNVWLNGLEVRQIQEQFSLHYLGNVLIAQQVFNVKLMIEKMGRFIFTYFIVSTIYLIIN